MMTASLHKRRLIGLCLAMASAGTLQAAPVVTNTNDSGPGSLRQAVLDAGAPDVITFDLSAGANTITLTSGQILINADITISGPGATLLTVRRDPMAQPFRIFEIGSGRIVRIEGLTIRDGLVQNGRGGGILNNEANLTLDRCFLTGNSVAGASNGGGVCNQATSAPATLTITNSAVTGNSNPLYAGGGVFNYAHSADATLRISNSTLSGNSAANSGGAAIFNVSDSTNLSTGIWSIAGITFANSTMSGNSAGPSGGAITSSAFGGASVIRLLNSTFYGNTGTNYGSAVDDRSNGWPAQQLVIANCIFKKGGPAPNIYSTSFQVDSYGYNISDDAGGGFLTVSTDQINTDPLLGPLKDNGGHTLTHAPLAGSPALDRGKNFAFAPNGALIATDQRGQPRPRRYDAAISLPGGGDGSDIGAVELAPGVTPSGIASRHTHGNAGEFDIPLPLSGAPGLENRRDGSTGDYKVVFTFAAPVTIGSAGVIEGLAQVNSVVVDQSQTEVTVNLTGVANAQRLSVGLFGVSDGVKTGDVGARMRILVGDTDASGTVNSGDALQTRSQAGAGVDGTNFRSDVNHDGFINSGDAVLVRARAGTTVP